MPSDTNSVLKRCTTCNQSKPLSEFYLISAADPHGPRRSKCKACNSAYSAAYRRNGPSLARKVQNELTKYGLSDAEALSPEVRAEVFTSKPVDPDLLAGHQARRKAAQAQERRNAREREKRLRFQPMKWGGQEAVA